MFLKEHLPAKARCRICKGHIDAQSITKDHIIRKREEGLGLLQNGQIAHPYCNSIYKRWLSIFDNGKKENKKEEKVKLTMPFEEAMKKALNKLLPKKNVLKKKTK